MTKQRTTRRTAPKPRRRTKALTKKTVAPPTPKELAPPETLTPAQRTFVETYLANGFNATQAYREAYPGVTYTTAMVNGCRMLRNAKVAPVIEDAQRDRWKRLKMTGDEALALLSLDARVDTRLLYDEKGEPLPPHLWPDEIALTIQSVKDGPYGKTITFSNRHAARKLLAEHAGVLKTDADRLGMTLGRILSGDFTPEEDTP